MIVVTYFTDRKYKAYADKMAASAKKVGLFTAAFAMRNTGSWKKNVYLKPHVVMKAMLAHPSQDILFVDADAEFRRFPKELVGTDWEFACYFDGPHRPVSGSVWIANTERGRKLVQAWADGCDRGEDLNEDFHWLRVALETAVPQLRVGQLPPSYFWLEEHMRPRFPTAEPVIEHFIIGEHSFK